MAVPPVDERLMAAAHRLTSSLADLDTRTAIEEVLRRVREHEDVDEAAVLLLDGGGRQLVAYASNGLEEEVRQGVRVPVGRGFAGRVAAERRPIILDDVRPEAVVNPLLHRAGLRTLLGVPLIAA